VKIGPVDTEIALLIVKKEINASKIYSPSGKFAERAKLCERWQCSHLCAMDLSEPFCKENHHALFIMNPSIHVQLLEITISLFSECYSFLKLKVGRFLFFHVHWYFWGKADLAYPQARNKCCRQFCLQYTQ